MIKKHKRAGVAWAMLLALLAWWHTSPAAALETWATNGLSEAAVPVVISQLNQAAVTAPQVYIMSPRPEEIIADTNVAVQLQVSGTAIFKNAQLGLGPHLHLLLDRVPTESIYDLNAPITLHNLSPGTHTLQVLANKPWHESWKNPQAFAQVTFHVLAKSADSPNAQMPQLISVQPPEVGAEPWLLDFYVANAPSHIDAQHPLRSIADWRVRATVNEQSFEVNRDEPIYLRGLRPGVNVLKLEYLNAQGQVADSAVRAVRYQPNSNDGMSRLVRNELSIDQALTLFDPQSRFFMVEASPPIQQPTMPWNQVVPSRPQSNPGIQSYPGMQGYPGMQRNPEMQGYPGTQGNSEMQGYPGTQGNSGIQWNPGTQSYPEMQRNPGMQGYSGMQRNPETQGYPGMQRNPEMQGNSGIQWNPGTQGYPGMQRNSISPVSPQSTMLLPPKAFSSSAEVSQSKPPPSIASGAIDSLSPMSQNQKEVAANLKSSPPNFSPQEIALLPPIQPSSPLTVAEPKKSVAALAPEKITAGASAALAPAVTSKQPEETAPTLPSPLVNPSPAVSSSEKVVNFKVIGQEILHATSAKIKHFTNQIPPLFSSWSENFRHWLIDRMAAMRASSSPTVPVESARPISSVQK